MPKQVTSYITNNVALTDKTTLSDLAVAVNATMSDLLLGLKAEGTEDTHFFPSTFYVRVRTLEDETYLNSTHQVEVGVSRWEG